MTATERDMPNDFFPSLAALMQAHNSLLSRRRERGTSQDVLDEVTVFTHRACNTGVLLDDNDQRRRAQDIITYWENLLYRLRLEPLDVELAEFDPLRAPELDESSCPYLGLDSFSEHDHRKFFGRQRLVNNVLEQLTQQRLVTIIGPSGSGKSSLVRAGIIPALHAGALPGSTNWVYMPALLPGSDPMSSLTQAFYRVGILTLTRQQTIIDSNDYRYHLLNLSRLEQPALFVIDQFEELFTLCDDISAQQAFINFLVAVVAATDLPHRVILTIRSDFEARVALFDQLQERFERSRFHITPLSADELRQVIEEPAELAGLKFEQGIVDRLLHDILGEPAGLPLLQFTLLKLWELRERNRVTWGSYNRLGGGRLALARSADAIYENLIPQEQITVRRILLRIIRPSDGLEVTNSRLRRSELYRMGEDSTRVDRVLDKLIQARLIRLTPGAQVGDDQIEVAHEALVRNWPLLVEWIEKERFAITERRRLDMRADHWVRLGRAQGGLLDEVELGEAERWIRTAEAAYLGYSEDLLPLIEMSRAAILVAHQEKEAANQRLQQLLREVDAQRLAFAAQSQLRNAPETALLLVAKAAARGKSTVIEQALRDVINQVTWSPFLLTGHRDTVLNAAFSHDGSRIVTSSDDCTARVWTKKGKLLAVLEGHNGSVREAVFSPDTMQIVTISDDTLVRLWSIDGHLLATLQGHRAPILGLAFHPNGHLFVTVSQDNTTRVWSIDGTLMQTLTGHTSSVVHAVFSPNGEHLLTASEDWTARLWNMADYTPLPLQDYTMMAVRWGAFSPDGQYIATASDDGVGRIWNNSGRLLHELAGHLGPLNSITFSLDGKRVMTASDDGTARIWERDGSLIETMRGHTGRVRSAAFDPILARLVTASSDGTARLWEMNGVAQSTLSGHTKAVRRAMYSPDGRQIVTISADATARVWTEVGSPLAVLRPHHGIVLTAQYSPDGQQILTASGDGSARLWDLDGKIQAQLGADRSKPVVYAEFSPDGQHIVTASTREATHLWNRLGQLIATLRGHTGNVVCAAFSPDGQYVATASSDHTGRIWSREGKPLRILRHHSGPVIKIAFSPDCQMLVTASDDWTAKLWDMDGSLLATLAGHTESVHTALFASDGKTVLTASGDGTARLWNNNGRLQAILHGHQASVRTARFAADGKAIVTASEDGTARIWERNGTLRAVLSGHTGWVLDAICSPDNQFVVTTSVDWTARLWTIQGQLIATLDGHAGIVRQASFSPEGRRIITSSDDRTARQYLVFVDDLLAVVASRTARSLNDEEIRRFQVPELP